MKVSRKVGRRSHKHTSSVSRRRLRNKNNKSGYRKKYAKTQKGGCWGAKKGGARGRKYKRARTHKRGKRFHRGGGGFSDEDIESGSTSGIQSTLLRETPTLLPPETKSNPPPETNIPSLDDDKLPKNLQNINKTKMPNALQFDYKRTDGIHKLGVGGTEPGLFDVLLLHRENLTTEIILLRRSKSNLTEYDKRLTIFKGSFENNFGLSQPFTGIQGSTIDANISDGIYTLPTTDKNKESFRAIYEAIKKASGA